MVEYFMNDKFEKNMEVSGRGLFEVIIPESAWRN
jgi:hypothetical protein